MCASCVYGRTFPTSYTEIPTAYGKRKIASGLIYVKRGNLTIIEKPFGYADYLDKIKFTSKTQIYIGSLKKQFIAAAVLKLMSEGKLNLHAPINTYIKFNTDLVAQDPAWITNTTLHHLLTHVSNVKSNSKDLPPLGSVLSYVDRVYICSRSPSIPLEFTYSSTAFALLEMVIESVSGMPAADYITHYFIVPLGMTDTTFHAGEIPQKIRQNLGNKLCYPYEFLSKNNHVISSYNPNIPRSFGVADMISTADDLCKWNTALYSGKAFNTAPDISNRLLQIMQGLYTVDEEGNSFYGYGIKTYMRKSMPVYWHEGLVTGASVYLEYCPGTNTHVIVFSNNSGVTFNTKTGDFILNMISDAF